MSCAAPALLAKYVKAEGLNCTTLAAKLGVTDSAVNRWMNGLRRPGLSIALKIEKLTAGSVKAADWLDKPSRKRRSSSL